MKKVIKYLLIGIPLLLLFLALWVTIGLYAMAIEDHYGDFQEFYYNSSNGDVMVLGDFEEIAIVDKTWTRVNLIKAPGDTTGLGAWIYYESGEVVKSVSLYRAYEDISLEDLNKKKLLELEQLGTIERIYKFPKER